MLHHLKSFILSPAQSPSADRQGKWHMFTNFIKPVEFCPISVFSVDGSFTKSTVYEQFFGVFLFADRSIKSVECENEEFSVIVALGASFVGTKSHLLQVRPARFVIYFSIVLRCLCALGAAQSSSCVMSSQTPACLTEVSCVTNQICVQ